VRNKFNEFCSSDLYWKIYSILYDNRAKEIETEILYMQIV